MFDNIGNKIKVLAKVFCWIGIIGSFILGLAMMGIDESLLLSGFLIVILGSLVSWISSFLLYGFGQLIQNTDLLVLNAKPEPEEETTPVEQESEPKETTPVKQELKPEEVIPLEQTFEDFLAEIKKMKIADLKLILQDQKDLYTEEELDTIKKELASREDEKALLRSKALAATKKQ